MREYFAVPIFILIVFLSGCSSSKKYGKDPSIVQKGYHDLTARDNAYFHARMKMLAGLQKIETAQKDDYSDILPIYKYDDPKLSVIANPEMDEIIKKTSKAIDRHEISKWIDDSYLLMGEAYYIKKDYTNALDAFQYIIYKQHKEDIKTKRDAKNKAYQQKKKKPAKKYSPAKIKSKYQNEKAKEKEKAKKDDLNKVPLGFLKHQKAHNEALLWLIHTYIAQEKYAEAQTLLAIARTNKKMPSNLLDDLEVLQAQYHIKKENYSNAIPHLEKALTLIKKKKKKTRLQYILAQLYQKSNKNDLALKNYKKVLDLAPKYEMEFNAKIKIAETFEDANEANILEVKELLLKMAKDIKNIDYLDQIYFALANVYLKEKDKKTAISYLKRSTQKSISNNNQKALSFLKLAEIYFEDDNYPYAKKYYDSTLAYLSKEANRYGEVKSISVIMTNAITQLNIISREDTLQYLASLSEEERTIYLDNLVKSLIKEAQEDAKQNINNSPITNSTSDNTSDNNSSWYFYNQAAKSKGYKDFLNKWGNRPLQDDWRRSNKQSIAQDNEKTDEKKNTGNTIFQQFTEYKESLLKNMPKNEIEINASNENIIDASYKLGNIYKQDLRDDLKARNTFDSLMANYPNNKYRLEVAYNLYLLYKDANNIVQSEKYKKIILNEFPESFFAKIIQNPAYISDSAIVAQKAAQLYEAAYDAYLTGNYMSALQYKKGFDSIYDPLEIRPKFDLLETLIIGKTQNLENFKAALKNIISTYPTNEVRFKAKEILIFLDSKGFQDQNNISSASEFTFSSNEIHYVCILLDPKNDVAKLSSDLANYNNTYHSLEKLFIKNSLLGSNSFLTIQSFPNSKKALTYYEEIKNNKQVFKQLKESDFNVFLINNSNLSILYKEKNTDKYIAFFMKEYLKK